MKNPRRSSGRAMPAMALLLMFVCGGAARAAGEEASKGAGSAAAGAPNIVLVLTDDQDVQLGSLSYMPRVKELLADKGTSFSSFFVPLSLCCPSRTVILRGQYPHNSQILTNNLPLGGFEKVYADSLESSTVATVLHGAGYRTVLLGKYLNGYPDGARPTYVPPGWDEWYSPAAGNPYSEFNYTLNENGALVKHGSTAVDYLTDVIAGKATDFIRRSAPGEPLFIYFATYAPHSPYTPAPRHAGLFPDVKAPRPPSFNEPDVTGKPAYIAAKPLLTKAQIDSIDVDYRMRLQALQAVDEAVAALISALESTGRLENTYVFFTSDNGYHMGEHRLQPGKYTPYETDLHVPLIVRGPGVPAGVVRDEIAANVDLAETFAELAGVAPLSFSDGRSLTRLLQAGPAPSWRQGFLLEEFDTGKFVLTSAAESIDPMSALGVREPPDAGDLALAAVPIPSYFGFQAPGYKYVEYQTGEKELYVASDPYELRNVAAGVGPLIAASLASYVRTLDTCKTDTCRLAEAVTPPRLLSASVTVSPPAPPSGSAVTLIATAEGTAPYTFTWSLDGTSMTGGTLVIHPADGVHTFTLVARDAIGAEAVVTRAVTVGTPPLVQIQAPSTDINVEAGVAVSFQATGTPSAAGGTMTYTWDFGDGTPAAMGSFVNRPFGAPGTYTVTLTGTDSRGSVATATRVITATRPTLTGASLLLPVVLETPGAGGSYYTSEVTIASRLTAPVDVLLAYSASAGGGSGYARLTLAPGEQQILSDILDWLRARGLTIPSGGVARVGTLLATFSGATSTSGLFLGARTFTADPAGGAGTFGLFYPAAAASTDSLTVFGLQQSGALRSNLALVNTSGVPITLRTKLLGPAGQQLASVDTGLEPYAWAQLNTPLAGRGVSSGVAVVSLVSGTGTFTAYGVLNDTVTSDGSFLPPVTSSASALDRLVPIVLSAAGYATELTLANLSASTLTLKLSFTASPQLGTGTGTGSASVTLAPNELRVVPDALGFLRQTGLPIPASGDAGGSLAVRVASGTAAPFAVGARTFVTSSGGGTFGLFYTGPTLNEDAASAVYVHGLQQNATQRSNLAVVNRGDASDAITVRITYFGPDGVPAGSPDTKSLAPGEWTQFNRPLESRQVGSGYAKVERVSGSSRFVAYGVLNDQTSSDGSYLPMSQ